jgi:hypothetical protein
MKLDFEKRTRAHKSFVEVFWKICKDQCIRKLKGSTEEDPFNIQSAMCTFQIYAGVSIARCQRVSREGKSAYQAQCCVSVGKLQVQYISTRLFEQTTEAGMFLLRVVLNRRAESTCDPPVDLIGSR